MMARMAASFASPWPDPGNGLLDGFDRGDDGGEEFQNVGELGKPVHALLSI
jgi:hypothetical protein